MLRLFIYFFFLPAFGLRSHSADTHASNEAWTSVHHMGIHAQEFDFFSRKIPSLMF